MESGHSRQNLNRDIFNELEFSSQSVHYDPGLTLRIEFRKPRCVLGCIGHRAREQENRHCLSQPANVQPPPGNSWLRCKYFALAVTPFKTNRNNKLSPINP